MTEEEMIALLDQACEKLGEAGDLLDKLPHGYVTLHLPGAKEKLAILFEKVDTVVYERKSWLLKKKS